MSEELNPIRKGTKKVLGRGLGSLLGEASSLNVETESDAGDFKRLEPTKGAPAQAQVVKLGMNSAEAQPGVPENQRIWMVAIEKLYANKEQPRKTFDPEKLNELANSVKERGILLPILARRTPQGNFEIIAGERRWRAAQVAGLKEVPVLLRGSDSRQALEEALVENVQRHDLNPMEEAEAYQFLAAKYNLTQQQIAEKMGKERTTIANIMRLSALSREAKELLKSGEIQHGQAKVLLSVADPDIQTKLARKAARLKLSVRALEKTIQRLKKGEEIELEKENTDGDVIREIKPVTAELQRLLGTKVEMDISGQRTKVSFQFYSIDELNQFVDKIRKAFI